MTTDLFDRLGRLALAAIFMNAIPGKITNFAATAGSIAAKGIPSPLAALLLAGAIGMLSLGSLLLIFGQTTRLGAVLLLVFLIPTTFLFHPSVEDPGLIRNVSLAGGLLLAVTRPTVSKSRS
jgi:putative oxidoreductase